MNKIKKGDVVVMITGKDKGQKGTVLKVLDEGKKLLIEGINRVKKHVKPNPNLNQEGGIVEIEKPVDRSNAMIYDEISKKGSKVGIKTLEDGSRVRYFKTSQQLIDVKG